MLKTQLRGKLNLSNLKRWQDCEDILTGDFFGTLDYLPRQPYLLDFLETLECLNTCDGRFDLARVDWETVEILFWPRCTARDDSTEPDVVLASNRWIIVIEAKLGSGFGENQPWREYMVGRQIAEKKGLPRDAVHYLVVSRAIVHSAQVLHGLTEEQRTELKPKVLGFRWLDATKLVEGWLERQWGPEQRRDRSEARILSDLLSALRRRRTLSFCGFRFPHHQLTSKPCPPIFCPSLFNGFVNKESLTCASPPPIGFLARFQGFLRNACSRALAVECMWLRRFRGFILTVEPTKVPPELIFCSTRFRGFVNEVPAYLASDAVLAMQRRFFGDMVHSVMLIRSVWLRRFGGFVCSAKPAHSLSGKIFDARGFNGLLIDARRCVASATMAISDNKEIVE